MILWHDDCRRPPTDEWTWARTNDVAKAFLAKRDVEIVSLDHDLGGHDLDPDAPNAWLYRGDSPNGSGLDLVDWMIANDCVPDQVLVHSMNSVGAERMIKTIRNAVDRGLITNRPFTARSIYVPPTK